MTTRTRQSEDGSGLAGQDPSGRRLITAGASGEAGERRRRRRRKRRSGVWLWREVLVGKGLRQMGN